MYVHSVVIQKGWAMKYISLLGISLIVGGCASPTVVETKQINDENLNCLQLVQATEEAESFEKSARGERSVTGTNVAAAIFFWPGLLATYANTDDAIDAAKERQAHLKKIYDRKGCSDASIVQSGGAAVTKELERLKDMRDKDLITEDEYKAARKKALGL